MIRRALLLSVAVALAVSACSGTAASPSASRAPSAAPSSAASAPAGLPAGSAGASAGASGSAVAITGVEYAFQGAPATATVGTSFTLVNGGKELHELVLVRKNADVPQTFEELLAMPQDQVMGFITVVGGLMAAPGATGEGSVTADKAGDYAMICFIPKGTTALPSAGASLPVGPPHFTLGMLQLITVQ